MLTFDLASPLADTAVADAIDRELGRQRDRIELIARGIEAGVHEEVQALCRRFPIYR